MEGTVFNIMRYSIHDGPGIRTTVFFKGCPLKCEWCHNPESHKSAKQVVRYPNKCIGCGSCVKVCPTGALYIKDNNIMFDINKCNSCEECLNVCYSGAMEMVGKKMTIDEVIKEVEKDYSFYDESGGGVTFSGGEPLMQHNFLKGLLVKCKEKGIHTAVDTCGYTKKEILTDLSNFIDLFLYDIKIMDDKKHKKYTGVSNKIILGNLKELIRLKKRIFVRLPIIPEINDDDKNIGEIADLLSELRGIEQINILPYHNIAMEKYKRLEEEYLLREINVPSEERISEIKNIFESLGFKVKIGG